MHHPSPIRLAIARLPIRVGSQADNSGAWHRGARLQVLLPSLGVDLQVVEPARHLDVPLLEPRAGHLVVVLRCLVACCMAAKKSCLSKAAQHLG